MKKRMILLIAILSVLFAAVSPVMALSVEQAYATMPEVSLFLHDDNGTLANKTAAQITAKLDDTPLEVKSLTPSEEGVFYIFMMDISRSMPQAHFEAAKQAVISCYEKLRQQDRLAVISFGDNVTLLLNGTEDHQQARKTLENLTCDNDYTNFYGAMNLLIETATATKDMRRCAVVISDGISTGNADMSQQQLEQLLQKSGVAVYALSIDTATQQQTENFRSFIQLSGGDLYPFSPADAQQKLEGLLGRIGSVWQLELGAQNNLADGAEHTLSVEVEGEEPVTTPILIENWIPDETPPLVEECVADEAAGTISLKFSEAMLGLGEKQNYSVKDAAGKEAEFTVEATDDRSAVLRVENLKKEKGWQLELLSLTDRSMEKNPPKETALPLFAAAAPSTEKADVTSSEKSEVLRVILFVAAVIVVVILGAVLAIFLLRRKKKQKAESHAEQTIQPKVRFYFENEDKKDKDSSKK